METVKDRLFIYMNDKKIRPATFERSCGLSNGYLKQLRSSPSADKLSLIYSTYPDLNQQWLITGEGEMLNAENKIATINEQLLYTRKRLKMTLAFLAVMFGVTRQTIECWESGEKIPAAKLPLVQKFIEDNSNNSKSNMKEEMNKGQYMLFETRPRLPMAATLGNIKDYLRGKHRDECDEKPVVRQFSHYDFTMLVNSNSMAPYIDTGDVIACAEIGETIDYGRVYVVDTDGGALIKRVYQAKNSNQLKLASGNNTYQDFLIDKSKIRGLYRVVGLLRVGI